MKKAVVFIVLAMILVGSCTAQSATNEAQKLVGTWVSDEDDTLVFNANGTGTVTWGEDSFSMVWGVSPVGGLSIYYLERWTSSLHNGNNYCYFSPDGKRMIYALPGSDSNVWLKK